MHKIDVIIPCYNYGRFLDECLGFVTAQTRGDFQVLVMDNASDDDTAEVAARWMARDKRIRYHRNTENLGAVGNMKLGYEMTKAEYVVILPADDVWQPTFLEVTCGALDAHPACTYAYTGWHCGSGNANEPNRPMNYIPHSQSGIADDMAYLIIQNYIPLSFGVFRRRICDDVGGAYPLHLPMLGDLYLWLRLCSIGPGYYIAENLGRLRFHDKNESIDLFKNGRSAHDHIHLLDLVFDDERWPLAIRLLAKGRQFQLLTGDTLAETVTRFGCDRSAPFTQSLVLQAREDLYRLAAKSIRAWGGRAVSMNDLSDNADKLLAMLQDSKTSKTDDGDQLPGFQQHNISRESYQSWYETYTLENQYFQKICRASAADLPSRQIRITVLIDTRGAVTKLGRTLESLRQQFLAPTSVTLLVDPDVPITSLADPPDSLTLTSLDVLPDRLQADHASVLDWILTLQAGDTLACEALYMIARALEKKDKTRDPIVLYSDHDEISAEDSYADPHFKPDANPDLLRSYPYPSRALVVRGDWLLEQPIVAPLDLESAYELALRAIETGGEHALIHIPQLLLHLDPSKPPVWVKSLAESIALEKVLVEHAKRCMPGATIIKGPKLGTFHFLPPLSSTPLISIIIPTRDQTALLKRCIQSLVEKTAYQNFEILIVDNDSEDPEALQFMTNLAELLPDRVRILHCPGPFNFSRMNNLAADIARGEYLLLLKNDTAALQEDWLANMVRHALRDEVGVVGAALFFPDGKIQHAGVLLGLKGPAEHPFILLPPDTPGYLFRAQLQQNYSAVTGACMLVRKSLYLEAKGLDESELAVSYGDIDLCLRVRALNKLIVWTPLAMLLYESSASELSGTGKPEKLEKYDRLRQERAVMYRRWGAILGNDPAYNPNLSLETAFALETNPLFIHDRLSDLRPHPILVFLTDDAERARYSLIQPFEMMRQHSLVSGGLIDNIVSPSMILRSGARAVVFQQPRNCQQLEYLEAMLAVEGLTMVFDGDDKLWNRPFEGIPPEDLHADFIQRMEELVRNCDRIVVSTTKLAEDIAGLNGDVRTLPSRLHPIFWGDQPPLRRVPSDRRKPRVGWTDRACSSQDVTILGEVIKMLAKEVDWVCLGECPPDLRPFLAEQLGTVCAPEYPSILMAQEWNLAIAPLADNPSNVWRSNIRLIELGWCGTPVICSDVTAYRGDLPIKRVDNTVEAWITAIRAMLEQPKRSWEEGLALQQHVFQRYRLTNDDLQDRFEAWTEPKIVSREVRS